MEKKEIMLLIEYNAPSLYKPFSVIQAHRNMMEQLFIANPHLELIPQELDNPPIRNIEKFPDTGEKLKRLADSKVNGRKSTHVVVFQKGPNFTRRQCNEIRKYDCKQVHQI